VYRGCVLGHVIVAMAVMAMNEVAMAIKGIVVRFVGACMYGVSDHKQ